MLAITRKYKSNNAVISFITVKIHSNSQIYKFIKHFCMKINSIARIGKQLLEVHSIVLMHKKTPVFKFNKTMKISITKWFPHPDFLKAVLPIYPPSGIGYDIAKNFTRPWRTLPIPPFVFAIIFSWVKI